MNLKRIPVLLLVIWEITGCHEGKIFTHSQTIIQEVEVSHNAPSMVIAEMGTPEFKSFAAKTLGIDVDRLNDVRIQSSNTEIRVSGNAFDQGQMNFVFEVLPQYAELRSNGHTREYSMASMLDSRDPQHEILSPVVATVRKRYPDVPVAWLQQQETVDIGGTNYTTMSLKDGPIFWKYLVVWRNSDGAVLWVMDTAIDAQEFEPTLTNAFVEAEQKADDIIAAKGIKGRLGACHSFWTEKKRILKEEYDVKWKSPSDLNPTTNYD